MKTVKGIYNTVTTVLVTVVVILALLLVGAPIVGLQVYAVLSGSMEPVYQTGALIYVKEADPLQLQTGDVITFRLDADTAATHRIVEILTDDEGIGYRTKGDANELVDGTVVRPQDVLGIPVFTVPLLGYLASYVQAPPGSYVAIGCGAVLLLLVLLPELFGSDKNVNYAASQRNDKTKK